MLHPSKSTPPATAKSTNFCKKCNNSAPKPHKIHPKTSSFSAICTIVGTMLGAGFASGQEIISFFGAAQIWAVLLSGFVLFLFALFIFWGLKCGQRATTIQKQNQLVFGKAAQVFNFLFLLCHFVVMSGMIAGTRNLCQIANLQLLFPFLLVFVAIIVFFGMSGIKIINSILSPLLIAFLFVVVFFGFKNSPTIHPIFPSTNAIKTSLHCSAAMLISSIVYVGMNALTALPVILPLGQKTTKPGFVAWSSAIIIFALFLPMLIILLFSNPKGSMPLLTLAAKTSAWLQKLGIIFLIIASGTTLFSSAHALTSSLQALTKSRAGATTLVFVLASIASLFGFSNIIKYLYPILGILGTIILAASRAKLSSQAKHLAKPKYNAKISI